MSARACRSSPSAGSRELDCGEARFTALAEQVGECTLPTQLKRRGAEAAEGGADTATGHQRRARSCFRKPRILASSRCCHMKNPPQTQVSTPLKCSPQYVRFVQQSRAVLGLPASPAPKE